MTSFFNASRVQFESPNNSKYGSSFESTINISNPLSFLLNIALRHSSLSCFTNHSVNIISKEFHDFNLCCLKGIHNFNMIGYLIYL